MIGLFAIGEVLERIGLWGQGETLGTGTVRRRLPRWADIWPIRGAITRGIALGTGLGAIPGAGHATIAAFLSNQRVMKARHALAVELKSVP